MSFTRCGRCVMSPASTRYCGRKFFTCTLARSRSSRAWCAFMYRRPALAAPQLTFGFFHSTSAIAVPATITHTATHSHTQPQKHTHT